MPEADSSRLNWIHVWGIYWRKTLGAGPGHGDYITSTVQLPVKPVKVELLSPAVKTASIFLEILGMHAISPCSRPTPISGWPSTYTTYCTHAISKEFKITKQCKSWVHQNVWIGWKAQSVDFSITSRVNKFSDFVKRFFLSFITERCGGSTAQTSINTSQKLCMKTGLSVVPTYGGAAFKKLVRIQLHHMHFSDITKDVVVAASLVLWQLCSVLLLGAPLAAYI